MDSPSSPSTSSDAGTGDRRSPAVTFRALLIAFALIALIAVASAYVEMVTSVGYVFAAGVPPRAPMAALFLLLALNTWYARSGGRGLSRREMLVVFCVTTIGAPLMSHGILFWMLACSTGQYYFVRSAPHWESAVLPYIPSWFTPTDYATVEGFFLGRSSVPWGAWITPAAAWGSFFIALFLANLCIVTLLQRQWIRHERLSFPIATIPLEFMRGDDERGPVARLPGGWPFWLGFGIAAYLNVQQLIPRLFPAFPSFSTWRVLIPWQRVGPLAGLGDIWLILTTTHIAIAYLIPKELSFSVWFFWVVRLALTIAAIAAGATPQKPEDFYGSAFPAPCYQGGGSMLAIAALLFWAIGSQLRQARRPALRGDAFPRQEMLIALLPLIGLLTSSAYMLWFFAMAGSRPAVGLALLIGIFIYNIVYTRLRAENGMSFMGLPLSVNDMLTRTVGSSFYRPSEIVTILAARWTYHVGWGEDAEVITGATFDSYKIADSAGLPRRRLALAMVAAFVFALAIGVPLALAVYYRYGLVNMHNWEGNWFHAQVRNSGEYAFELITNPAKPDNDALLALGAGAAFTFLLNAMRLRFWWWPFHPIGYLAANAWGTQWWYMPFFVGWLAKTLVVRYGGLRLYQRTIPIAVGAIIGDLAVDNLWPVAEWLARMYL
ncbi:MAG: DUF6785 family protein [Armatimonadota bacterium]